MFDVLIVVAGVWLCVVVLYSCVSLKFFLEEKDLDKDRELDADLQSLEAILNAESKREPFLAFLAKRIEALGASECSENEQIVELAKLSHQVEHCRSKGSLDGLVIPWCHNEIEFLQEDLHQREEERRAAYLDSSVACG